MIQQSNSEREQIELLLPWYEKGTLNAEDTQRVEAFLSADAELRSQLTLIREEVFETISVNEELGMPTLSARDRLMNEIAKDASHSPTAQVRSLTSRLSQWLPGGLSPGLALAAAAAVVIIVAQAVTLISVISSETGPGYRVAAGGDAVPRQAGTFVIVRFAEGANAKQITDFLRSVHGEVVEGPKPGGAFKVRLSTTKLAQQERDALLQRFRAQTDIVAFVSPSE